MRPADRHRIHEMAEVHGGVVSRRDLARLGVGRDAVAREVDALRWAVHGTHTIAVHRGPLPAEAGWWRAVWEVGHDVALLDGVSSLLAAGMVGFSERRLHVSVTRNARCPAVDGVRIHRVRRRDDEDAGPGRVPRTRPDVASIRAAGWATTDRQAALLLALPVQQRLVHPNDLLRAAREVRVRGRRPFIRQVVLDICSGAQSLGELDFALMCRRHGVPEPERQAVCRGARGRVYLDVRWRAARLVVEIDGAGHRSGLALTSDNLRQNAITLEGDRVLRFDLLALRLEEGAVMTQVRRGLGGCV